MKNYTPSLNEAGTCLEEPRIKYISHKAKGVYANILLDDWFKRTFEELPSSKRLLPLLLQELIPERQIASIKYAPQEHTNPNPDKKGIRVDVECTDADGTRFLVEMQREPQDFFYERADGLHFIFLELPNCGKALSPEASVLDNFCFSLHNMQFLEERPVELRQEIFELLFDAADIATFAPEDKIKYEYDMTTERDIHNQIRYAERKGMEKGMERNAIETARRRQAAPQGPAAGRGTFFSSLQR